MLSCAGNDYVRTPNLDSLARAGVRFERAYVTNPVCMPSRMSLMTGRMPSSCGIECNEDNSVPEKAVPQRIVSASLGHTFREAGYRTVYGGKVHLPKVEGGDRTIAHYGFELISSNEREELARTCAAYLKEKHERPFLMVASFINPHDICYMAINAFAASQGQTALDSEPGRYLQRALRRPEGVSEEEFFRTLCPPLPRNLEVSKDELSVYMLDKREFQRYVRQSWTDRDWRLHRWAYARLTEQVDREIGIVLEALRETGREQDTLVVMTSDHGDQDASHRLEHKEVLYEESVRVPLIVSWKGVTRPGAVDREHLVSNGLDLHPTLCDFAAIRPSPSLSGRSLRALAEGRSARRWRDYLVVENHIARLVHTGRWKYKVGRGGKHEGDSCLICRDRIRDWDGRVREMLIDLEGDPGEMENLAPQRRFSAELALGRKRLAQWYRENGEKLAGC